MTGTTTAPVSSAAPATTLRVGFIGLGSQGGPMARRIVEAGFPTTLWARRPEALEAYVDTSAHLVGSAAELGARVDVACVCVVDDAGVEEVVDGLLGTMAAGGVIVVHSTVHPDTCTRLAARAAEHGIGLVDAPVSGGGRGAAAGHLLVMVGGPVQTLERLRPVFETYGDPIVHLGDVGSGQRAKLLNNLVLTANLAVLESAYALAAGLHVDPAALAAVLGNGSGNSYAVGVLRTPGFSLAPMGATAGQLLHKDVGLVADLAETAGVDTGALVRSAADAGLAAMGTPRHPGPVR